MDCEGGFVVEEADSDFSSHGVEFDCFVYGFARSKVLISAWRGGVH